MGQGCGAIQKHQWTLLLFQRHRVFLQSRLNDDGALQIYFYIERIRYHRNHAFMSLKIDCFLATCPSPWGLRDILKFIGGLGAAPVFRYLSGVFLRDWAVILLPLLIKE